MKRFFENMGDKTRAFMQGRYGTDELSHFLSIAGLVILLLACFIRPMGILYIPALALLAWSWFRSLSKNIYKRQNERGRYMEMQGKVRHKISLAKNMWSERKTHRYYKCPHCKVTVRIVKPRKGKNISITCPKCHNSFGRKT